MSMLLLPVLPVIKFAARFRKPLFRGHDYVEQINLILDVLGTPPGNTVLTV